MIATVYREWVRKKNRATVQRLCPFCGRRVIEARDDRRDVWGDHLTRCERRTNESIELEEISNDGV